MPYQYPIRIPVEDHLEDHEAKHIAKYIDKQSKKAKASSLKPSEMLSALSRLHPQKFGYAEKTAVGENHRIYRLQHVITHLTKLGWKKKAVRIPGNKMLEVVFQKGR